MNEQDPKTEEIINLTLKELGKKDYKATPKVISDLEECLKNDFTVEQACIFAGISQDTYYRWIKESEEFKQLMKKAEFFLNMVAKKNFTLAVAGRKTLLPEKTKKILKKLKVPEPYDIEPSVDYSLKFLKLREKDRYSTRTELSGPNGESLNQDTGKLTEIATSLNKLLDQDEPSTTSTGNSEATT